MTNPANPSVLTVNGGSSSIKFALFEAGGLLSSVPSPPPGERAGVRGRIFDGRIEGIGFAAGSFTVKGRDPANNFSRPVTAADHPAAVALLMDWIGEKIGPGALAAVGHRVVHGGPTYWEPQRVTPAMLAKLRELSPFDPDHLPEEILLAEAFQQRFPGLPQIACFDTAFHHDLPRVARLLPIPRRYEARGIRRYGFHGLSCTYLLAELARVAGADAAQGRVILAHLGNGASITAVRAGKSMDTSMGLTPTAGLPMSNRSGDLDPGLVWFLAQTEQVTAAQFHQMINHESGLLGVSETTPDMRELLRREKEDVRAAEAVALFCQQAKKYICAMTGVLEGLDTLVFAGGIGENAPEVRERVCRGLEFIGIRFDGARNLAGAPIISAEDSPATVRVIRTDEEWVIARMVCQVLDLRIEHEN